MSFWSDLGSVFSGIGSGISDVTGFVGDQLANVTGVKHIGEGFGENFGENFAKNFPTTFTLNHNVNVSGKIDVSVQVNAQVNVGVDVNVNLKDAIAAARVLRDGLVRFDIFGGLFRQLAGDASVYQQSLPLLREMQSLVQNGVHGDVTDRYLIQFSLINDSAVADLDKSGNQTGLYEVAADCGCALTIGLNGHNLVDGLQLQIAKTPSPVVDAPRIDKEISVTSLLVGNAANTLSFRVDPFGPSQAALNLLAPCRLQIRLFRKTKNWKYTVVEWFFDGRSTGSSGAVTFYIQHPTLSPKPDPSPTAQRLAAEIGSLIDQISLPILRPPGGGAADITQLVSDVLLAAYTQRSQSVQKVLDTIDGLDGDDPNGFDVRTPIYAALSCSQGSVLARIRCLDPAGNAVAVVDPAVELKSGDELAVLLPFAAGPTVPTAAGVQEIVDFLLTGGQSGGSCSASIYYGLEWATRVIESRTLALNLNQAGPFQIAVRLADRLAGH